ncbi:MAG: hypothetical protein J6B87_07970 [Clostridia bacterium]|nr:hypothetical protein [Clostridia bacterium]
MSKKFLSILLFLALVLACYVPAFAEEAPIVDTVEWLTVTEARTLFQEFLGEDCDFSVTCRTAYQLDQSLKAWIQIEAQYANVASATLLRSWEYSFDSQVFGKISENGAEWVETDFIIDPEIFPHDFNQELILNEEWGEIRLNKARVEEFLTFCLKPQAENN